MPVFDYVCSNLDCKEVSEKIVKSHTVETIDCPKCGAPANKPEIGHVQGAKLHRGTYFNYIHQD